MNYNNKEGFTKKELIELGINYDNMNYPLGETNVIVQWLGFPKEYFEEENCNKNTYPDIYMPRENRVCRCEVIDMSSENEKKNFIAHLRDSAERLKVWSFLLCRQADELEKTGYTDTVCYYPQENI